LHLFVFTIPHPLASPLFPYTTLFRSLVVAAGVLEERDETALRLELPRRLRDGLLERRDRLVLRAGLLVELAERVPLEVAACTLRSEEHTSELQSRSEIVCRLLLEKKK